MNLEYVPEDLQCVRDRITPQSSSFVKEHAAI